MNKRGSVIDIVYIVVMLLVLAMVVVIAYKIFNPITDDLATKFPDVQTAQTTHTTIPRMLLNYDFILISIFVFGTLASVILAFFVESHPVFGVISIILMIIFVLFAGYVSNVYEAFEQSESLQSEVILFPITSFFFAHLPKFMLGGLILVFIVTFSKRSGGQGI